MGQADTAISTKHGGEHYASEGRRGAGRTPVWHLPRQLLGPLGRYRPSLFRMDMADGFEQSGLRLPRWLPRWISPEDQLLEKLALGGKTVYDIGAHTGTYTLFFSRRVGEAGRVVAFEPQPENFARLTRNIERNRIGNVQALRVGLGAVAGERPLFKIPGMATTASMAGDARTLLRRGAGSARV